MGERFKWPPYNKENYIEFDAKNPTLENGLVLKLEGKTKTTKRKRETNKEDR